LRGNRSTAALGKVSLAICALVFVLVYRRYLGILGADRRRSAERQTYDGLRNSLAEGNLAARLYAERLPGSSTGLTVSSVMPPWLNGRSFACFRAEDAGTTLDGSCVRSLSVAGVAIPGRYPLCCLGSYRTRWPGRAGTAPSAQSHGPVGGRPQIRRGWTVG
jgi:hypothetical protein